MVAKPTHLCRKGCLPLYILCVELSRFLSRRLQNVSQNIHNLSYIILNNHLCYADDLCLIALSSSGMQCLLDICDKYATGHQLTYNATK